MTESRGNTEHIPRKGDAVPLWQPVLVAALAGGMGWGIRGQYGHETGAMIAGLLVGLVLVLFFCPRADSLRAARVVAWCTIAMGFGGSMTYGQTVGLTHDAPLTGNWAALRWGMLGLAIKGGIWIGFAGAFLGMGLSGVRYRPREMLLVMLGLLGLSALGIWALNEPFDPVTKVLPRIYFSDDWRWEPGADLKPRREVWGGLLFALAGLIAYTRWRRRDSLAPRLALWGVLGGATGFPLGQSLQAFHAWNLELFRTGVWASLDPLINWWNFMETTFGAVMGAALGLGLWLNRQRITSDCDKLPPSLAPMIEWLLLAVHVALLVAVEFMAVHWVDALYDFGLVLGLIPVVAVAGGRWWPYLVMLPVTALPIAGKTLRHLAYKEHAISLVAGWILYVVLPLAVTIVGVVIFARPSARHREARTFLRPALLFATWLYFGLNFAFFHFPWPWSEWTSRTPNAVVFALCAIGLTVAVRHTRPRTRIRTLN
ncbi:MAG TPA: hypothetical protein VJW76_14820 [Verrucomicrobiae bacterium]|nr:hypothetical protein [Verrucomicrobiae bacterium]